MKPTEDAAEILITEDPNYPEGLYAFVDYDYDPNNPSKYRKLKWVCKDAHWQALLNSTLSMLIPYGSQHHYPLDHPNPPRHAALVAEEAFGIKILSEGITRRTGVIIDEDDDVDENPYVKDDADE
jgi:hypothetical protein